MNKEKVAKVRRNLFVILIVIIISMIPIGIYIYNSANETVQSVAKEMEEKIDRDYLNLNRAKVKPYIGEKVKGSEVITMIETIVNINLENANQIGKFITINAKNIEEYDNASDELAEVCNLCNYYGIISNKGEFIIAENGERTDDEESVSNATEVMKKLESKIVPSKTYKTTVSEVEGMYACVTIEELPNEIEE